MHRRRLRHALDVASLWVDLVVQRRVVRPQAHVVLRHVRVLVARGRRFLRTRLDARAVVVRDLERPHCLREYLALSDRLVVDHLVGGAQQRRGLARVEDELPFSGIRQKLTSLWVLTATLSLERPPVQVDERARDFQVAIGVAWSVEGVRMDASGLESMRKKKILYVFECRTRSGCRRSR